MTSDAPFSNEKWPQAAKNRAALIARLDGSIGRITSQLAESRLTNNVVFIFASAAPPEKFANTNLIFTTMCYNFKRIFVTCWRSNTINFAYFYPFVPTKLFNCKG